MRNLISTIAISALLFSCSKKSPHYSIMWSMHGHFYAYQIDSAINILKVSGEDSAVYENIKLVVRNDTCFLYDLNYKPVHQHYFKYNRLPECDLGSGFTCLVNHFRLDSCSCGAPPIFTIIVNGENSNALAEIDSFSYVKYRQLK